MNELNEILSKGIPVWALILYGIYMAAVQALPRPDEKSALWYVWLYGFAHGIAINVKLAFSPRKTTHEALPPGE